MSAPTGASTRRRPVVMKFGGTSVKDATAIARLSQIVTRETRPTVVVVSALAGVTDRLIQLSETAGRGDTPELGVLVDEIRQRHVDVASEAVAPPTRNEIVRTIDETCGELGALVHAVAVLHELSPRSADAIAAFGELLSSRLVCAALRPVGIDAIWGDARQLMVTDGSHGRAMPNLPLIGTRLASTVCPMLDGGQVPVIGGYIGATEDGVTTTLGRGGSDFSASLFGAALEAAEIQIWTDVDGMLTADPRVVTGARLVPQLTFGEASELAYFGAKVLHPATIQPAVSRDIPVRILNAQHADRPGTTITEHADGRSSPVTALACKGGLTVIEITSARMLMAHGFLRRLFEVFDRFETPVDVVTTSEVNVSVTIDNARHLPDLVGELSGFAEVRTEPEMALLCVVGEGLHDDPAVFPRIIGALDGIGCRMVSLSASRRNLTLVLRQRDLASAMTRLHDRFFAMVDA